MSENGGEIALVGKAPDRARAVDLLARGWPDGARIDEHESALELAGAIGAGERRPRAIVVVAADPSAALESLRALRDALSSHHIAIVVLARGGVPSLAEERELLAAGATELGVLEDASPQALARHVERAIAREEVCDDRARDHHAAELSARAAEQRLASHLENSPLAVIEWGPGLRCVRWTGEAEHMLGWPAAAALGRNPFEWHLVHEADVERVDEAMAGLLEGREHSNVITNRNYRADGSVGTFKWHNSALLDDQGRLVSIISLGLDITERRATERALAGSESRFRTIAEATPSIVFVLGRDGAYANSRWAEYFGSSLEDAMRRGWSGLVHPADEASAFERWARAEGTDETFELELRLIRHDGEARWHLVRTVPLRDASGRIGGRCGTATDVHGLKTAQQDLQRALELLRAVAEAAPEPIYAKDTESRLLFANPAAERSLGSSLDELRRRDPNEYGPQAETAAIRANDLRVLSSGQTGEFEEALTGPDGTRLYRSIKTPLRDPSGAVVGIVGVSRDVTEQRRYEHALLVSEARAKDAAERAEAERAVIDAILEAAPVAIMVADACGKVVRLNPATERLWGRLPPVKRVADYAALQGWWTDGASRRGQQLEADEWALARALRGETVHDDIVEIEPFGGPHPRRTIVNSAAPVRDADGNVTGAVGAQMDISELVATEAARRESEERFRALADNITQLAWIGDADGGVSWVNRRWLDYAGIAPDRIEGWGWQKLVEPEHRQRVTAKLAEHVASGEPWEDTFPMRGASGERRWFLSRAAPIRDASGRVVRWFGTSTDVTAQREAEDALHESARRKDEFLSMLAHELRNPLAPLRFAVALLGDGSNASALARARAVIDRQVSHMARLIDDLLDVSRIARGRIELRKEICDVVALARQTTEDHRLRFENRGVAFTVSTGDEPLYVLADPVRVTQMMSNLLDNAAKYTERGGRVELRVERTGEEVRIVVEDTGAGIDPELASRIFDPFAQADQGLARSKGGLGLGLALTRGLAQLHGGTVSLRSDGLGRGSTFTITLPLRAPAEPVAPRSERAELHGNGRSRRVLIVEDNRDAADMLATLLETAGHHASIARDGAEGLSKAHEQEFDVVVCDLGLPGMSGYDVARALRQDPEVGRIRLIALSGYARDEDRQRAREAGFDEHLAKPVDLGALLAQLDPAPAG